MRKPCIASSKKAPLYLDRSREVYYPRRGVAASDPLHVEVSSTLKKTAIPDYREKQHLLYAARASERDIIACGDRYREADRLADAAECYQRANHRTGLETIRELAEAAGDVMLYQLTLKALNRIATPQDWDRIGQQAFALGKYFFSLYAFEKSENGAMIEKIKKLIPGEARHR